MSFTFCAATLQQQYKQRCATWSRSLLARQRQRPIPQQPPPPVRSRPLHLMLQVAWRKLRRARQQMARSWSSSSSLRVPHFCSDTCNVHHSPLQRPWTRLQQARMHVQPLNMVLARTELEAQLQHRMTSQAQVHSQHHITGLHKILRKSTYLHCHP